MRAGKGYSSRLVTARGPATMQRLKGRQRRGELPRGWKGPGAPCWRQLTRRRHPVWLLRGACWLSLVIPKLEARAKIRRSASYWLSPDLWGPLLKIVGQSSIVYTVWSSFIVSRVSPRIKVLLPSPFCMWGKGGSKRSNNSSEATQPVKGRIRVWT